MAVTRLKRKALKNKRVSKHRNQRLALEGAKPVIRNVNIEELKKNFKLAPSIVKEKSSKKVIEENIKEKPILKKEKIEASNNKKVDNTKPKKIVKKAVKKE